MQDLYKIHKGKPGASQRSNNYNTISALEPIEMNVFFTKTKMKANRTHLIAFAMCIVITFSLIGFVGCTYGIEWLENEFFIYHYTKKNSSTGELVVRIGGITEKGKAQEYLVIPDEIDGYIVNEIFNAKLDGYYLIPYYSPLKKIYISKNVKYMSREWIAYTNQPLKRIYLRCAYKTVNIIDGQNVYAASISQKVYRSALNWYYFQGKKSKDEIESMLHIANLTYLYNYEGNPNRGIYFLDDLDEGEKVIVKPTNPQREGYNFDGWYTEEEGINEVDFYIFVKENIAEETIFYAKWTKILNDY